VDLVTAGQAFHWFDAARALPEFDRILRPNGWLALVWNVRLKSGTRFLEGYERLLTRHAINYARVDHAAFGARRLRELLGPSIERAAFHARQDFELEGLRRRAASSSYVPQPGHPSHAAFFDELERLFHENAAEGRIAFLYETELTARRRK
jgi:SAM-dependent methyltransferase